MNTAPIAAKPARKSVERAVKTASDAVLQAVADVLRATGTPTAKGMVVVSFDEHGNVSTETYTTAAAAPPPRTLGDMLHAQRDHPAVVAALERGAKLKLELLAMEGGQLTGAAVAARLGISRQGVDKRRRANRLVGLTTGRRGISYPAWQFTETGVLRGLDQVLAELGDDSAWTHQLFMLRPNTRLDGETPLAVLRLGALDRVLRAAEAYGEHGAS